MLILKPARYLTTFVDSLVRLTSSPNIFFKNQISIHLLAINPILLNNFRALAHSVAASLNSIVDHYFHLIYTDMEEIYCAIYRDA